MKKSMKPREGLILVVVFLLAFGAYLLVTGVSPVRLYGLAAGLFYTILSILAADEVKRRFPATKRTNLSGLIGISPLLAILIVGWTAPRAGVGFGAGIAVAFGFEPVFKQYVLGGGARKKKHTED